MAAVLQRQARRWTYEDDYKLDDERRYEVIDGELLLMAPGPDTWHQSWVGELYTILRNHVNSRKLGKVLLSPVDVVLDPENTVQPDLVFVSKSNLGMIQQRAIFGSPDLVVELISPSSVRKDRYVKQALYARFGIKEYCIGDPANKTLEILTLKDGSYHLHTCAEEKGKISSPVLPGLVFDLADIQ